MNNYFSHSLWEKSGRKKALAKNRSKKAYIIYMLNRTQQIFEYDELPETINKEMMELYMQTCGACIFAEHEGAYYVLFGGWGGEPNAYYLPTKFIVANPYLKLNKTFTIDEDCVLLKNDTFAFGLMPMFERYSELLTENDVSIRLATINLRTLSMISSADDNARASAEEYLRKVEDGVLGVAADAQWIEGIKVHSLHGSTASNYITQLIELQQYLKASWFNELGLQANYNMKRESLNSSEVAMDSDVLLPLIDNMLKCRQEAVEKINNMFGLNISVRLSSSWGNKFEEIEREEEFEELEVEEKEAEVEELEAEVDKTEAETEEIESEEEEKEVDSEETEITEDEEEVEEDAEEVD